MPYSDALAYLHGSGSSSGPLTSTANSFSGYISGTTLTVTTNTTYPAELSIGQYLTGTGVTSNTVISAGSGTSWTVSISQTLGSSGAPVAMVASPPTIGDQWGTAGSQYSNLELDFGAPNTGGAYPWLPQFPSLTEKGYTFAPEIPGAGGSGFGVHIIITAAFNTLTSMNFEVVTASHSSALVTDTILASRVLTLAQMQVIGAHYYIPVPQGSVLEFLRLYGAITGSNATLGALIAYYGPPTGMEL